MDRERTHINVELSLEELRVEIAEALPERAAMSTLNLSGLDAAGGTVEAVSDGLSGSAAAVHESSAPAAEPVESATTTGGATDATPANDTSAGSVPSGPAESVANTTETAAGTADTTAVAEPTTTTAEPPTPAADDGNGHASGAHGAPAEPTAKAPEHSAAAEHSQAAQHARQDCGDAAAAHRADGPALDRRGELRGGGCRPAGARGRCGDRCGGCGPGCDGRFRRDGRCGESGGRCGPAGRFLRAAVDRRGGPGRS